MNVFVARQPILDRNRKLFAYELLFRSGTSDGFPDIDGTTATTSLLSSTFFTVGIDKVTHGRLAFINFTEDLLTRKIPELFPTEKLMVEILEDVAPSPRVVEACRCLKEQGYKLALDDFVYEQKFDELIALSDIIKIDFRLTPADRLGEMLDALQHFNCQLLAEKVETYEEFQKAMELGFDYFQGYFFSKPEVLTSRDLSASQLTMLRLLAEINSSDSEFDVIALEQLVTQDIGITYKLLKYINSAHFGRITPISSIAQAISFLGENGFRMFVSLIATSMLAEDKPSELIRASIVRAKFLELVGQDSGMNGNEMFLLGLFSLIDAMLDQPIETILSRMPLAPGISQALCHKAGELYPYFRLVESYEKGNWIPFRFALKKIGITEEKISDFYLEALAWADSFTETDSKKPD